MKFESTGKWSVGNEECFYDEYPSREEALKELNRSELTDVGQVYYPYFTEEDLIYEFDEVLGVLEKILYDEFGDNCDYRISDKYQDELAALLAKVAIDYINEHKLQPNICVVKNIENVVNR